MAPPLTGTSLIQLGLFHLVRRFTGTRPLPHHGAQRRFACGAAAVWLAGTGLAFHEGSMALGYALGSVLTAVATIVSVTHFCIPSLVYNTLFRRNTTVGLIRRSHVIDATPRRS